MTSGLVTASGHHGAHWFAATDPVDHWTLERAVAPVLDIGCGAGRHVLALAETGLVTLGVDDVPAMMELTALTKPGPFSAWTHELGTFLGIRVDGQLVAMAGERMKPAQYTEITAVCVHPSHRGRGYGQMLLSAISRQIVSRGKIPFLHVFTSNHSAIALYRRQGMEIRRRLHVTVLKKED